LQIDDCGLRIRLLTPVRNPHFISSEKHSRTSPAAADKPDRLQDATPTCTSVDPVYVDEGIEPVTQLRIKAMARIRDPKSAIRSW